MKQTTVVQQCVMCALSFVHLNIELFTSVNKPEAKFSQNNNLKKTLCDTGTRHLAEASRNDQHFGIGIGITHPACLQKNNWKGGNKLGEALMDARKELRKSK